MPRVPGTSRARSFNSAKNIKLHSIFFFSFQSNSLLRITVSKGAGKVVGLNRCFYFGVVRIRPYASPSQEYRMAVDNVCRTEFNGDIPNSSLSFRRYYTTCILADSARPATLFFSSTSFRKRADPGRRSDGLDRQVPPDHDRPHRASGHPATGFAPPLPSKIFRLVKNDWIEFGRCNLNPRSRPQEESNDSLQTSSMIDRHKQSDCIVWTNITWSEKCEVKWISLPMYNFY